MKVVDADHLSKRLVQVCVEHSTSKSYLSPTLAVVETKSDKTLFNANKAAIVI